MFFDLLTLGFKNQMVKIDAIHSRRLTKLGKIFLLDAVTIEKLHKEAQIIS